MSLVKSDDPSANSKDTPALSSQAFLNGVPTLGPIDIRSVSLGILTLFATVFMLYWAKAMLLPLVFSILLSYALEPIVSSLQRLKIPRPISTALIIGTIVAIAILGGRALEEQAEKMLDKFPAAMRTLSYSWRLPASEESLVDKVQKAAVELDKAAKAAVGDTSDETADNNTLEVKITEPGLDFKAYFWAGSMNIFTWLGQVGTVIVLVFLLLASDDFYKRKLVKISGPRLSQKKITVQIIDDFNQQLRRYFFVLLLSSVFVGLLLWLTFVIIGVEQAALWGLIAGVVCLIPYLGPVGLFAATTLAGLVQFGTPGMALTVGFSALVIANIQSSMLTPWLTSRSTEINRVALFVGLLFFGWLWGLVGLIVATPMLIIFKVCCDHIENLQSVGELLGKSDKRESVS